MLKNLLLLQQFIRIFCLNHAVYFIICRRKKKCIRYLEGANGDATNLNSPDDNLGSAGSVGEAMSPDSKGGMDSDLDGKSSDMGMSPSFSLTSPGLRFYAFRTIMTESLVLLYE